MVGVDKIIKLINVRQNRVLTIAEASLPEGQFKAFRKLFLGEFGDNGLRNDLHEVFEEDRVSNRLGRNGRE